MTSSSRNPRPRVVEKKYVRSSKKLPTVTGPDLTDRNAFQRAIDVASRRRHISDAILAKFAARLGGAKQPQQWMDYRNGQRPIPDRDKVIGAIFLETTPEKLFPSWEKPILPMLLQVLAFADQMSIRHDGQESLGKLLQWIAAEPPERREEAVRAIKEMLEA